MYVCSHLIFEGQPPLSPPQSCRIVSMGTTESAVYSSLIEHEETLYQLTLGACQRIVTAPGPVTRCDSLSSHMVMRDLI
jgi:hypothetical protein